MATQEESKRRAGHRQRLRQRFLEGGLERFTDEDVIEFLLSLGTPRRDTRLSARQALKELGSLSAVLSAPLERLTRIPGIGSKNALYLKFVHEVARRYLEDRALRTPFFRSSREVYDYLLHSMRDLKREIFKVLLLTRKNALMGVEDLFQGGVTGSAVYPGEVMALAVERKAAALIFAHNHPSGDPSPSAEDRRLTRNLVWGARLLGIQVLDHLVIGNNTYYSFADQGLIRAFSEEYDRRFINPAP